MFATVLNGAVRGKPAVITCDKREAFAQGSEVTKSSNCFTCNDDSRRHHPRRRV